ncbi:Protein of unknown function [Gryllus bimaculatus]|nr:Protein of unknown function [Gryllus bimaculatus]
MRQISRVKWPRSGSYTGRHSCSMSCGSNVTACRRPYSDVVSELLAFVAALEHRQRARSSAGMPAPHGTCHGRAPPPHTPPRHAHRHYHCHCHRTPSLAPTPPSHWARSPPERRRSFVGPAAESAACCASRYTSRPYRSARLVSTD